MHAYPPLPILLEEDNDANAPDAAQPPKSTSTKSRKAEATHKPTSKGTSDVKANAVIEPTPLTDLTTLTVHGTIPMHTGILPVFPPATPVVNGIERTPGFSPLPTITSLAASGITSSISALSTHTPRRRPYPTPSLPILQDPFADQAATGDEESLFGGKERLSAQPGTNPDYKWTHYSHPSLSKTPVLPGNLQSSDMFLSEKSVPRVPVFAGSSADVQMSEKVSAATAHIKPFLVTPAATPLAVKRTSLASQSIYPGTPQSAYGIAVGSASPLTADGMPLLQRNISKSSARRRSRTQRSISHATQERHMETEDMRADIYDGLRQSTAVVAPPAPVLKKSSSVQGRARVKASYAPGSMMRASTTMGALGSQDNNPFDDSQYVLPPLSPALKTEATRARDTKALASALGLASPMPLSPQTTVYPDDSITLAGERRKSLPLSQVRSRPQSQLLSPNMEASARLGNLMLANFSSMTSLPSTRTVSGTVDTGASGGRSKVTRKRADDKPPRVPSPPPLPSLAQMALSSANPEEYGDYRSPTYSIYGLYEADRKSRAPGEGGY
ncbi:hypothetical protein FOMPIDRAFT_1165159 [Fomitopsis schrenkii]|uniref:Uncharacterized protein n=1 Tax=Fomitopsis schrenkii TaxID=2126942 RepID=S8FJJ5_FOMSC|nr:hypothetical protein FOMPIDRAFT_1165159 [Fomitopsis schrenkii]